MWLLKAFKSILSVATFIGLFVQYDWAYNHKADNENVTEILFDELQIPFKVYMNSSSIYNVENRSFYLVKSPMIMHSMLVICILNKNFVASVICKIFSTFMHEYSVKSTLTLTLINILTMHVVRLLNSHRMP